LIPILNRIYIQRPPRAKGARKAGRPRSEDTEKRILEITLRHLARQGYNRMSLDAIAAEAGSSKPTIYRRWSGKAGLATAALRALELAEAPTIRVPRQAI
jgi:AcrR family transcriptional regulator